MRFNNSTATTGKAVCSRSVRIGSPALVSEAAAAVAMVEAGLADVVPSVAATVAEVDLAVVAEHSAATAAVEEDTELELALVAAEAAEAVGLTLATLPKRQMRLLTMPPPAMRDLRPSMFAT